MKIDTLTSLIRTTGVFRRPAKEVEVDYQQKLGYVSRIGMALLEHKGIPFSPSAGIEEMLVDWVYMRNEDRHSRNFFSKGILLKGPTGTGKTFTMKILMNLLKVDEQMFLHNGNQYPLKMEIVSAARLAEQYQESQSDTLNRYAKAPVLCIDDIGSEPGVSSSYGNRLNVVQRLIYSREENNMLTFGTSNLEKFSDSYDDRTVSRMNSLFNVIVLDGEDRRKS